MNATLYYIHDPMCSWCYGFVPTWKVIQEKLPSHINVEYVVGGLAPDSDQPMPDQTRQMIMGAWQRIEHMLGSKFNYDFWTKNTPRRSTYPACRAVLAARAQNHEMEMIAAIQKAYYQNALNPSDDDILIRLAHELSLDVDQFTSDLNSDEIERQLMDQIALSRKLSHRGFPSLVLETNGITHFIDHNYLSAEITLSKITSIESSNP